MSGLLTCPTYGSYRLHHQDMGFRAEPMQHRAGFVTGNEDGDDCTHCLKRKMGTHEVPHASNSTGFATKAATIYDVCVRALAVNHIIREKTDDTVTLSQKLEVGMPWRLNAWTKPKSSDISVF